MSKKKNHNHKNNNYKKEFNTMNNNFENAEGQVMAGQEAAQQNMVNIVKGVFEFAGFNTDFLNNPKYAGLAAGAQDIRGLIFSITERYGEQVSKELVDKSMEAFDIFITMDDDGVEIFNNNSPLEQASLFLNVLTCVGVCNRYMRAELLNYLLTTTAKCNGTEQDMTAARAWMLYLGLLIPQIAA